MPDRREFKEIFLKYGCDDYLCKPYKKEDLILRCKILTDSISVKYNKISQTKFIKYDYKTNIVKYKNTYLPLTQQEVLLFQILIEKKFLDKQNISKYLNSNLNKKYSEEYITVLIHRINKKVRLCTGLNLIKNKYGCGYYLI